MELPYADWRPDGVAVDEYLFDQRRVDACIGFIEDAMILSSGFNQGKKMRLLDWQKEVFTKLLGTVRWSWELERFVRQYRSCNIWIPRKNGKTTIIAALAIYLLSMDMQVSTGVPGKATILCGALTAGQADQIFKQAKGFIQKNKYLNNPRIFKIRNGWKEIEHVPTGSILKVVAQGDDIKLGSEPTTIIIDELAVQKNADFINSLKGGQGSTAEPLLIGISTAGYKNKHKYGFEEWSGDKKIHEDQTLNPQKLVFMRPLDETADWEDEELWRYANPSLGQANSFEFLREQYREVKLKPSLLPWFKAYYLNIWGTSGSSWIEMHRWELSGQAGGVVHKELLDGRLAYGGLDLSSKKDMTCFSLVLPGKPGRDEQNEPGYTVLTWSWATQYSIDSRDDHMKYKLKEWAEQGHLKIFDGDEIQFEQVRDKIVELCSFYDVQAIGMDTWGSKDISQQLEKQGIEIIDVRQSAQILGPPTAHFEALVLNKRIYHGFNPVLTWNLENAAAVTDNLDRTILHKKSSAEKIDGLAATMNAVYLAYEPASDYEAPQIIEIDF
ncbi:terminase large subunit [Amycolatopsis sp. lyj-112]|uniref:terminase large subunit n=1 Tax=Amycolatopsis sp. lyj-112 TaxID=2789288 RepID=UPI00397E1303